MRYGLKKIIVEDNEKVKWPFGSYFAEKAFLVLVVGVGGLFFVNVVPDVCGQVIFVDVITVTSCAILHDYISYSLPLRSRLLKLLHVLLGFFLCLSAAVYMVLGIAAAPSAFWKILSAFISASSSDYIILLAYIITFDCSCP